VYTIDASVHINAINPTEAGSSTSQAFLTQVNQHEIPLFCPTLLLAEVAATVARSWDNNRRAIIVATSLRRWPNQTFVPLDGILADRAIHLAATARLRGADAIYAAIAEHYGTTLVTLDRQQLERLPPVIRVLCPTDALRELETQLPLADL
jgi:predicted nucleic acid-binding protein